MRPESGSTGARYAAALRVGLGALLIPIGLVLVILAIALRGAYPTGITRPYATALGVTGGIAIVVTLIALVSRSGDRREKMRSPLGIVALVTGAVSLLAFVVLVLGNASIGRDHTLPTAARFVPVGLGIVAALLGVLGMATSRGDAPRIRASSAALVMGLGSAIVPLWLWTNHCYLFKVDCL